jgi:hypothetical protein
VRVGGLVVERERTLGRPPGTREGLGLGKLRDIELPGGPVRVGESRVRVGIGRVPLDRSLIVLDRALVPLLRSGIPEIPSAPVEPICLRIARSVPNQRRIPSLPELDLEGADDLASDLLLHSKNVLQVALVVLGPEVLVGTRIDELRGDAYAPGVPSHAAFEDVSHPQLARDLRKWLLASLVVHRRGAGDDPQLRYGGEAGDDLLGQPIVEELVVTLRAHVDEGQDGNRSLGRL